MLKLSNGMPRRLNVSGFLIQKRNVFWLLYAAANKIDAERIKLIGPDRACAEWLVKCGASVRFHGKKKPVHDYNKLGVAAGPDAKLAEVYADQATIMAVGFPHFRGVDQVEKLTFKSCSRFDDACIQELSKHVCHSVKEMEIDGCGDISDSGLSVLHNFRSLRKVSLANLPYLKDPRLSYNELCKALPNCHVNVQVGDQLMSNEDEL